MTLLWIGLIAAIILVPHSCRTFALSGASFGAFLNPNQTGTYDFKVTNEQMTPAIFSANIIRNIGLHLGAPSKKVNHLLDTGICRLLGKETGNPRSTWVDSPFHVRPSLHEDEAGNPLHFIAIVIAFALLFSHRRYRRLQPLAVFAGAIISGFLFFCLALKWQPFHSRLHLPLFALSAPVVAVVFSHLFSKSFRSIILALFLLGALPWLFFNASRPLIGTSSVLTAPRIDLYFVNRPALKEHYLRIAAEVRRQNPGTVGLALSEDDWEYPWWVLLKDRAGTNPRIEHALVANKSRDLEQRTGLPDLIISTRQQREAKIGNRTYVSRYSSGTISILAPQESAFPQ